MDISVKNDTDDKSITFDLNDISNDDIMGISLLADPNKSKENSDDGRSSVIEKPTYTTEDYNLFDTSTPHQPSKPIEMEKKIELNTPSHDSKYKPSGPTDDLNSDLFSNKLEQDTGFKSIQTMNAQDIKNEKIDILYKFRKLESQGIRTTMNYNMNSHLDDMRNEYLKLKKQREVDGSIKFQRKAMMAAITGLEFLNNKFDPAGIHLDGWSESVNENIYDYDEVFEELYEKYGGVAEVAPEIKLLMLLGGSAFMFHLTHTMFKTSMPGMNDIMKDNPELMKQFASAAMGNVMGAPPKQPEKQYVPEPPQQNEMVGPEDIDDIIANMNLQPDNIDFDQISVSSDLSNGVTMNLT
jgi:hypothetical protein